MIRLLFNGNRSYKKNVNCDKSFDISILNRNNARTIYFIDILKGIVMKKIFCILFVCLVMAACDSSSPQSIEKRQFNQIREEQKREDEEASKFIERNPDVLIRTEDSNRLLTAEEQRESLNRVVSAMNRERGNKPDIIIKQEVITQEFIRIKMLNILFNSLVDGKSRRTLQILELLSLKMQKMDHH